MDIMFSIVILTKDSMGVVQNLITALLDQEFPYQYEVIFMDNSSKDGTVNYLKSTPFKHKKVIHVPEGEFSHSGTRMRASQEAVGAYMMFFTDDIIPIGKHFLTELAKPVLENKATAAYGVCQVNPETHDPIDAYIHNNWWEDRYEVVEPISRFCWDHFTPELRRRLCNFDNCSSCITREVLLNVKFPAVPYGEDMLFAKKLILNNQRVAISKGAKFYHWHKVSFSYLMKRMCIDQHLSIPEFEIYYIRRKLGVIKAIVKRTLHRTFVALFKLKIPIHKKFYWIFYNIKTLTADFIGKYMGVLDENSVKGFSPINKRLLRRKQEFLDEIYNKSIKRY
ncbi:MAG: glycosyltransferase [Candidatus Aminicenantes bacterium]|nr:glycosyltransferase [Candidatus Aminicenantes bacterium]NIM84417.1 glycosyltransferase [Candidatus Aminicenantes bacterium]NIN23896.1 glycosyltransferase [Candidatus Aminicenantes bacterium]NIN47612.1 glycosyltransferase [Candidatus Aminicenantes bacterium]NIN90541.1 glycosyltransferase [Candidatus Aminicenantes bacterium]